MSDFTITLLVVGIIVFFVFLAFIIRILKDNNSIYKLEKKYNELITLCLDLEQKINSLYYQGEYYEGEEE